MFGILADAILRALTAGAPLALFFLCVRPALLWQRARAWAVAVLGVVACLPALTVLPRDTLDVPRWFVGLAWAVLMLAWLAPRGVVRVTGGVRSLRRDADGVLAGGVTILQRLDVGALDDAGRMARGLEAHRTPSTAATIDLLALRVEEERRRRAGEEVSSQDTMARIRDAVYALLDARRLWPTSRVAMAVGLVAAIGAGSALVDGRACIGAERLIVLGDRPLEGGSLPLDEAIAGEIEPNSTLRFEEAMDLERAAESRHDPATRDVLVSSGFVGAHARWWTANDGRMLHADVFEFESPSGARAFQHAVNRYACRFADEAFEAPMGGIGLQVRWSEGDPIEEQVSWVVGSRRYLVSVRALAPPPDHGRVLGLVDATREASLR